MAPGLDQHASELADPVAVNALAQACRQDPGDSRLWRHLGLALLGDNHADGYRSAASAQPGPFQQATASLHNSDLDAALAWACLARAADRVRGALLMAQIQLALNQPDHAAEALADAASHIEKNQLSDVLAAYSDLLRSIAAGRRLAPLWLPAGRACLVGGSRPSRCVARKMRSPRTGGIDPGRAPGHRLRCYRGQPLHRRPDRLVNPRVRQIARCCRTIRSSLADVRATARSE